ncbi:MAG TPA: pyridoxamine 5'-phosphate oxidase family protein [Acidimicrobiales bacterium]|nr:pyridoxamine 5'-phosphate oxidase family protein [Acidimicrobiales bacterium]
MAGQRPVDAPGVNIDALGFELLSPAECRRLLAGTGIGRVGFHARALPRILPVAFALDGDGIVVPVRAGSELHGGLRDAVVAFEADGVGPGENERWSVSVTGMATEMGEGAQLDRARGLLADGCGPGVARFVRISLDLVTGRRGPVPAAWAVPGGEEGPRAAA